MIIKQVIKKILLLLNYIVSGLLLLVYISVFINPSKLWIAAFFGLAYPYLLLANLAFFTYWLIKRKRHLLISLITIIIGWSHISSNIQFSAKENKNSKDITLLSYNIQMLEITEKYFNDDRKKKIVDLMNSKNPDFACFQEYFYRYSKPYHVPKPWETKYQLKNAVMARGNPVTNYGLAIFSKYPLIAEGEIRFQNSINFCLFGDYLVKKDTIRIYNVHLQSIKFRPHDYMMLDSLALLDNANRMKQARNISIKLKDAYEKRSEQVIILKKHIEKSPYKTIVCGDFNDTPVSFTYHKMTKILDDSFKEGASGIGNTYIGKIPSYRIDYIFHDKSFETICFQRPRIKASDHYPVSACLSLSRE